MAHDLIILAVVSAGMKKLETSHLTFLNNSVSINLVTVNKVQMLSMKVNRLMTNSIKRIRANQSIILRP